MSTHSIIILLFICVICQGLAIGFLFHEIATIYDLMGGVMDDVRHLLALLQEIIEEATEEDGTDG